MCLKVVTKEVCEIKGNPQTVFCREIQEATDAKKVRKFSYQCSDFKFYEFELTKKNCYLFV